MNCAVVVPHNTTIIILNGFGVDIAPCGQVIIADLAKAEGGYVHHSAVPVALTAFAQVSPMIARGRFPKMRLVDLVAKRPVMDVSEAQALATSCGIRLEVRELAMARGLAPAFKEHLTHVIHHYALDGLFGRDRERPACNHIDWKPYGFDWRTSAIEPKGMLGWRVAFKSLPTSRQIMAATVLCLYRGEADKTWLSGIARWHAADAIAELRDADALRDWAKLVALYPGW